MVCRRFAILVLLFSTSVSCSKQYTASELAYTLKSFNVSDWEIPILVCLAHHASGLKTGYMQNVISFIPHEPHYGLFGIPERFLTDSQQCNKMNQTLSMDENLLDDVQCVMDILNRDEEALRWRKSRLYRANQFLLDRMTFSECLKWWQTVPPCLSSSTESTATYTCRHMTPIKKCIDESVWLTVSLVIIFVLTIIMVIYLMSQLLARNAVVKPSGLIIVLTSEPGPSDQ